MNRVIGLGLFFILLPLYLIIVLVLACIQGLPVFFSQERVGIMNCRFKLYKFRTMIENPSKIVNSITTSNDVRVTKIGGVLRKFKIDELPQLINIIKGDINFVGPRPEVTEFVGLLPHYFSFLETCKPGITDLSSIIFKNESELLDDKNPYQYYLNSILPVKSKLAQLFVKKNSFILRISIVCITIISIFHHELALRLVSIFIPVHDIELRHSINHLLNINFF